MSKKVKGKFERFARHSDQKLANCSRISDSDFWLKAFSKMLSFPANAAIALTYPVSRSHRNWFKTNLETINSMVQWLCYQFKERLLTMWKLKKLRNWATLLKIETTDTGFAYFPFAYYFCLHNNQWFRNYFYEKTIFGRNYIFRRLPFGHKAPIFFYEHEVTKNEQNN